jgi:archaellum component FlaC
MTIVLSEIAPWVAIVMSAATLWYAISTNRSKATDKKIEKLETGHESLKTWIEAKASREQVGVLAGKIDLVEDRVTIVENDMRHLPDKDTTHRLEVSISEMRGEMRGLTEKIKPIAAIADRWQEVVMEKVMS